MRTPTVFPECGFNTQPPEGGWSLAPGLMKKWASFNTQPPEGGWTSISISASNGKGFNTQPPEGGWLIELQDSQISKMFQHTAARRRLDHLSTALFHLKVFQHSAARRRLGFNTNSFINQFFVSTLSRPKAAGTPLCKTY